jgi:hypothetical protein
MKYWDTTCHWTKQSPSWEAGGPSAVQEINRPNEARTFTTVITKALHWNLSQLIPVHILTSYFFDTDCNIILPSMPRSPKWSSFRFSDLNLVCTSHLAKRVMSRPSHSPWFYHLNNIWWREKILKLPIKKLYQSSCYSSLLDPRILLSALLSNILNLRSSNMLREWVTHLYRTGGFACKRQR